MAQIYLSKKVMNMVMKKVFNRVPRGRNSPDTCPHTPTGNSCRNFGEEATVAIGNICNIVSFKISTTSENPEHFSIERK